MGMCQVPLILSQKGSQKYQGQICKMNKAKLLTNNVASLPWEVETETEAWQQQRGPHGKQKVSPLV